MKVVCLMYALLQLLLMTTQCTSGVGESRTRHKTKEDSAALRRAAQRLLGLRDIPTDPEESRDFDVKMAPKYMLDLYEKYKNGRIRSGKQVANTVRSIQAEVGVINTRSMFVFNLSSIFASEKILKAEVHLYKRHVKRSRNSDIYMEMNELGPNFLRKLDHRRIPEMAEGWQAADVTTAVEACLGDGGAVPRMMALAFLTPRGGDDDGLDRMKTKTLVRRISRPYLIVYSNDTQNISIDHIQPRVQPTDLTSTYVEPSTGLIRRFSIGGFPNEKEEATTADENAPDVAGNVPEQPNARRIEVEEVFMPKHHRKDKIQNEVIGTKRVRRSVLDNEIPEDPDEDVIPDGGYVLPKTHPGILLSRKQLRRKLSRHRGKLIPYPEGYRKRRRKQRKQRRKHRKHRDHRRRTTSAPFTEQWHLEELAHLGKMEGQMEGQREGLCTKRTLTVDFADIGWSEWIISPRSFEANYCSGSCPFPLAQRLKPSNHATIQSLVHAIGFTADVPGPCCVPEKLSAVTLLYFDENKNVVLKNYPEMSVESCSCR